MINEQDKQRIERAADSFASEIICDGEEIFLNKVEYKAYIAGATAELERSEKLHKEEEVKAEQNAFHLVKALDLLDECHHYLKANPPDKSKMTYNKWESLIEETDYMREFNSEAEYERINGSEKLLQEALQVLKELWEYSPDQMPNKGFRDAHNRAKSLIETTSKPEKQ